MNKKLAINIPCFDDKEEIKKNGARFSIKNPDITVYKTSFVVEYDKDGNKIVKRKREPINLTRKINETAKLIKQDIASAKLSQIEKLLNK